MSFAARHRAEEPCDSYFGNLCSGFGGTLTCLTCGWDQQDHPREQEKIRLIFADLLGPDDADNATTEQP